MVSKDLRVALLPFEIEWGEKEKNLERLDGQLKSIHPQTDLLILPETFSTGFPTGLDKEEVRVMAEKNTGQTIEFLKKKAAEFKYAICGSFIADTGGLLYNRLFFIEPTGEEYFEDKRHLFSMAGEDLIFSPGKRRMRVRYRGWNISMVACYDIRFPVWCRNIGNEYDLLIAVANWPEVRISAWKSLLNARAIENESYVCGVNCCGVDSKGITYDGSSEVIDFKGKPISVRLPGSNVLYATLSRDRVDAFREKFPAWKDQDKFIIE